MIRLKFTLFSLLFYLHLNFVLIDHTKCEKQYELNCLDKDCSDILFEGFSQYVHPEDNDHIKLHMNEHLKIYGENEQYYLTQKENQKGLVKKNYVKIEKAFNKDKPLIKVRASFENKKLNPIKYDEDKLNETNTDYKKINDSDYHSQNGQLQKQQSDSNVKNENSNHSSVSNTNTLITDKQQSDEQTKSNYLKQSMPLVKKLHARNFLKTEKKSFDDLENFDLKEPEIQNFSNDHQTSTKLYNDNVPDFSSDNQTTSYLPGEKSNEPKKFDESTTQSQIYESINKLNVSDNEMKLIEKNEEIESIESNEKTENKIENNSNLKNDFEASKDFYTNDISEDKLSLTGLNFESEVNETSKNDNEINRELNINSKDTSEINKENLRENKYLSTDEETKKENIFEEQIKKEDNETPINYQESNEKKIVSASKSTEQSLPNSIYHSDDFVSTAELNIKSNDTKSNTINQSTDNIYSDKQLYSETQSGGKNEELGEKLDVSLDDQLDNSSNEKYEISSSDSTEDKRQIYEPLMDNSLFNITENNIQESLNESPSVKLTNHSKDAEIYNLEIKNEISNQDEENSLVNEFSNHNEGDAIDELNGLLITDNKLVNGQKSDEYCLANNMIKESSGQPSFYIILLRSVLGRILDFFPQSIVLFMEVSLQISTKLLMFIFLIGLLWIVLYVIKLFHLSISNETVLKNYLCESQNKLSLMQRERDDLRSKLNVQNLKLTRGLEEQQYEIDKQLSELKIENENLKESNLLIEKELEEQKNLVKNMETKLEKLYEKNDIFFKEKNILNETLTKKEVENADLKLKLDEFEKLNKELIVENEEIKKQVEEYKFQIDDLKEQLFDQSKLISEKEIEISCLNKMLDEFKESNGLINENTNKDELDLSEPYNETVIVENSTANFYDIIKLRCKIEKLEKERDEANNKLKLNSDETEKLKNELEKFEQECIRYNEVNNKVTKEKEEAEKYLDFLKKYYNENKNELQKELGVYQYKEKQLTEENKELQIKLKNLDKKFEEYEQKYQISKKEFEETEKQLKEELLTSNKSACDYFKSAQALRAELSSVKKDAEYLRQQLRNLPLSTNDQSKITTKILPPPEIPKSILDLIGQLSSGQMPPGNINSSNINLNNIANSGFITAPSPIQRQSFNYDYQPETNQLANFQNLQFTSQPSTFMYNNAEPVSANFQQIVDPMMANPTSSLPDTYASDYHYTSLPNIPYSNHQLIDPRFNSSMANYQQNWDQRNCTPSNETINEGNAPNSPNPSLHKV